jgi:TonB-linked SusC/RagA family outer membrane protein
MIEIIRGGALPEKKRTPTKTIMVMRLTALILLITCLHVSAAGWAQKVTLNEQGASLIKIFKEIKQQTGYVFFYKAGLLDNSHPVSIVAKDEDLNKVLEECLQDQPVSFNIVNKTIVLSPKRAVRPNPVFSLNDSTPALIWVTGRVTDESGKIPIAGANVMIKIKGSPIGNVSNQDGVFNLNVPRGASLVISFVGYISQEVKPKENTPLNVKLVAGTKDPLANMVVTGYQVINKESFTGNAITVSGEELKKVNPNNILQSLQAFDPSFSIATNNLQGSNPNVLPSINVRGSTALPASSSAVLSRTDLSSNVNLPTFILDGYEVSLEKVYDLDVNRIQSVTLLKDAAATAVYGSRAANGVLVITTKAPKEGKLSVYYNYELTPSAPDLSAYHVLNASQKLQYESLAGLYTASNSLQNQDQLDKDYYQKKLAVISGVNTDWLAQPLRNAFGQKHSMFVEGGTPQVRYGIDLQYQTAPGVMKGSGRDRYGLAVDLSYSPTSKFIFKNVLSVQQVNTKESPYGNFTDYVRMNPYYPKTDSLGHIVQNVDSWVQQTGLSGNSQYQYTQVLNPMFESTLGSFNKSAYLEFTDNFSAEWSIARGLRLRSVISYDRKNSTQDYFVSPLSNQFYFYSTSQAAQRGYYYYSANAENTFDGSMTLNYNQQIGPHFFNVALGANARTYSTDFKSFEAVGFASDQFSNIGFAASYAPGHTPGGGYSQQRLIGSFLNANYSWLNKYLLDLSVRADGSSLFGENNRVAPSWATGIGWNVHKEDFFRNTVVSQLRLRASTGLTGSVSFPPYMAQTTYNYYTTNWYATGVGAVTNNYGNENLKWQQTHNYDAGMDLGLFKDRIVISPRYYYKLTKGMLADIQLPPSAGFSSYTDNLGDMVNKGWELNFKVTAYHNRDWNVNVFANLVHNTNVIKKISNSLTSYNDKANQAQQSDSSLRTTPLLHYQEGQSVNEIYAVRSLGIDPENGKEIFVKRDGTHTYTYDVKDIAPLADPTPKVQGSFGTAISYKGFQFNTLFMTTIGGKDYNQTLVDRVDDVNPRYNVDSRALTGRWKNPGDHAQFKGISDLSVTYPTSRFIQNLSTLDLSSVYLSYDFSRRVYSRLSMKNLRIALTANEVYFWSTEKIERGIDYPYARSFTFSIQTSF